MLRFIVRRMLQGLLVLLGVTIIVFILIHLSGDPVQLLLPDRATPQQAADMRERLGLDQPLPLQYIRFLGHALVGDFGSSIRFHQPAMSLVVARIPATLVLTGAAMAIALLIAIPAGIVAALRRGSVVDRAVMSISLVGYAVPTFWLGIMLILIVSVGLRWLPASGAGTPQQLVLPAFTLGFYEAGLLARLLRRGLVDAFAQDYIRTARSKGLPEPSVLTRHALKNAAIPVVTVFGLQVGALLGGAVITETVFAYPGMGLLVVQAIHQRDFAIVEAFVLVSATAIVVVNLLVDLTYGLLDPRVRSG